MYNTDFTCSYHIDNSNYKYQQDYANAFSLTSFIGRGSNANDISNHAKAVTTVYKKMEPHLSELMNKMHNHKHIYKQYMIFAKKNDNRKVFDMLLMYETFYLVHDAICQVENQGTICEDTLKKLDNVIFNYTTSY